MEEDIAILERFLRICDEDLVTEINVKCDGLVRRAVENLIKGYREKEESEKYLYEAYQDAGKKMFEYAEELEQLKKDFEIVDHECSRLEKEDIKKDKLINLMAEQLTTPIHSKEWVIDYYKREIEK